MSVLVTQVVAIIIILPQSCFGNSSCCNHNHYYLPPICALKCSCTENCELYVSIKIIIYFVFTFALTIINDYYFYICSIDFDLQALKMRGKKRNGRKTEAEKSEGSRKGGGGEQ